MKRNEAFIGGTWNKEAPEFENNGSVTLTISKVLMEQPQPGEKEKPVVYFEEDERKWIIGVTVFDAIAQITGKADTDDWEGERITLYVDPTIRMGGKAVGGVRCRAPGNRPSSQPQPTTVGDEFSDDNIPF